MKKQEYVKELERVRAVIKVVEDKISEIMGGLMAEIYKEAKKDACTVNTPTDDIFGQFLN